ncbi:MAG TPA: hypothetical protein DEA97_06835 [Bacteroidales bacterium]|nr:MAG: hypothetical protein UR43_C0013G0006 [candidate division TM6 bacterium GW2011_GWF2_33_332]OFY78390.1 MAG: hypothetical protein A2281_11890 [Bacteroidetes bacterium RIFOXYA12_FULL_38_20]HBS86252.1 hypothetical protein [Bacteroidales bacterium]
MIKIQPYDEEKCWWCGNKANSQEHRHKKSDVKHIFGNRFEGEPVVIRDNHQRNLQGPDSKLLKFKKVLCKDCNNRRSQPFDRAYDLFVEYVLKNYDKILINRIIDFSDLKQNDRIELKHNVFRYLTKVFCCRLASNNISIEPYLIEFLNHENQINFLYYKFEVRPDIYAFLKRPDADEYEGNIYLSPLRYIPSLESNKIKVVYQFYNLQWLRIYTFYSEKLIEDIYNGYREYNNSDSIPLEVRYSVKPDQLFDKKIETKSKEQESDNWLEEYLNINIFKKIKTNRVDGPAG